MTRKRTPRGRFICSVMDGHCFDMDAMAQATNSPAGTHEGHSLRQSALSISEVFRPANAALLVMSILGLASRAGPMM
jgi:hypothetical protein